MIPSPDFRLDISITIADEVIRMSCATIGFAIAIWGMIRIISLLVENAKNQKSTETNDA